MHESGKPFLLHSCGCIFDVMDDLIAAGVGAKRSNEDQIASFPVRVERYGDRIGNSIAPCILSEWYARMLRCVRRLWGEKV